jgi:hypothetical protein
MAKKNRAISRARELVRLSIDITRLIAAIATLVELIGNF